MAGRNVRRYGLNRYDRLYSICEPFGPTVCTYCGDPADSYDHVVPICHLCTLPSLDMLDENARRGLIKVPCCIDCNSRLADFLAYNISDKRRELKRRLRNKHQKLLHSADWHKDELSEMGPNMVQFIRTQEQMRDWIHARLARPSRSHTVHF